jgi:hypothetical protein
MNRGESIMRSQIYRLMKRDSGVLQEQVARSPQGGQ